LFVPRTPAFAPRLKGIIVRLPRSSGILLHPTSLPSKYGIGDLGPAAFKFADFLEAAGQRVWQVLPLGPTTYGDSPYQSFSAFAGNPLLISPELLVDEGVLSKEDLKDRPDFPEQHVEFEAVIPYRMALLEKQRTRFSPMRIPMRAPGSMRFATSTAGGSTTTLCTWRRGQNAGTRSGRNGSRDCVRVKTSRCANGARNLRTKSSSSNSASISFTNSGMH
jgi:hypothetical protein